MYRLFAFLILAIVVTVPADEEIDQIIAGVQPPVRYDTYTPNFSYEQRQFTFNHATRAKTEKFWVIRDGAKYVAVIRCNHNRKFYMLGFDREALFEELFMPTGRYHMDTEVGPEFVTSHGGMSDAAEAFEIMNDSLVYTRTLGNRRNRFILYLDRRLGYCLEAEFQLGTPGSEFKTTGFFPPGTYEPWMDRATHALTVWTPANSNSIVGFYNNSHALDRIDQPSDRPSTRDGGFIGCLSNAEGWGFVKTRRGGGNSSKISVCNAHNAWHETVNFPSDGVLRQRLIGLPPGVNSSILTGLETIYFEDDRAAIIRLDTMETFEDQPRLLNAPIRGLYSSGKTRISTEYAYSGNRSLEIRKYWWPNLPQVPLWPNSTFRLEAMVMVKGEGAEGYITGKTYEWSPHGDPTWYDELQTEPVTELDGWKKVQFEITTSAWDPFIDFRFHVGEECYMYVDDFKFECVKREVKADKELTVFPRLSFSKEKPRVLFPGNSSRVPHDRFVHPFNSLGRRLSPRICTDEKKGPACGVYLMETNR